MAEKVSAEEHPALQALPQESHFCTQAPVVAELQPLSTKRMSGEQFCHVGSGGSRKNVKPIAEGLLLHDESTINGKAGVALEVWWSG